MQYDNSKPVFKGSQNDKKPLRYSQDSFVKELIGKVVKITLSNGQVISGRVLELGMYDCLLEIQSEQKIQIDGQSVTKTVPVKVIVLKSAILTVQLMQ